MPIETSEPPIDQGGEPPCWAHLVEDGDPELPVVSNDTLAELVRAFADAVLIADPGGTIIFWNTSAERLFGWTAAEAQGNTLDLIIPARLRARHWEGWRHVIATGETRYGATLLEVPALHRDGRGLSVAFTVTLLTAPDTGQVTAVAAVLRDDTARWQQRREQRDEIARLRAEPRLAIPMP
jgi:PAS domain S-box-containing protein